MLTTETATLTDLCAQINALPDAESRQCALFYLRGLRDGAVIRAADNAQSEDKPEDEPEGDEHHADEANQ